MTPEERRLINQQNARKSTGPKTPEGKARSRRNALKHGLTGSGRVLPKVVESKLQAKLKEMNEHLQPVDPLEKILVTRIALAGVRLEACVQKELVDLEKRRQRALTRWEARQLAAANDLAQGLEGENPAEVVAELQATSFGCDWLVAAWEELAEALRTIGHWNQERAFRALRLMGQSTRQPVVPDGSTLRRMWDHALDLDPELVPAGPVDRDAVRADLLEIVSEQIDRLAALADQRWSEHDQPAQADVQASAGVNTTAAGQRLHRYETASELSLHRNLNQLVRLRKIEPEHQSVARWHATGKLQPRRWNGINYEPTNPYYSSNVSSGQEPQPGGPPCPPPVITVTPGPVPPGSVRPLEVATAAPAAAAAEGEARAQRENEPKSVDITPATESRSINPKGGPQRPAAAAEVPLAAQAGAAPA